MCCTEELNLLSHVKHKGIHAENLPSYICLTWCCMMSNSFKFNLKCNSPAGKTAALSYFMFCMECGF